ncbi:MAG: ATPase, partial [Tsuneonella sp.]
KLVSLFDTSRTQLDGTDKVVAQLTDASVRLLELIQASVQHSQGNLTEAIAGAEERLSEVGRQGEELRLMLGDASAKGSALSGYVVAARQQASEAMEGVDAYHARFAATIGEHGAGLTALRGEIAALSEDSAALSGRAQGELRDAIAILKTAARDALTLIESGSGERIEALASTIGDKTAQAVEEALRTHTTAALVEIDRSASQATGASRDAVIQLRDQLGKVNELVGNLEMRVARARERAEEQVDHDFSRRVALITEALNSNAIDIAKALSSEVTDTAWTSYLRGDRGIFTRRAVRLLDNTQAREIAEIYDADADFREHVSRYIHDFEAMLRTMLSTRDGHALGVTLLSSDMGKLYVALAQSIERLRS